MPVRSRGTRRAGRLTLLWCALLWGAAETGGALAPPCANATPLITTSTDAVKPVGDPDTPDEGGHQVKLTDAGSMVSPVTGALQNTSRRPAPLSLWEWLRSLMGLHFPQD
jgi:hypothetical protein